MKVKEIPVSIFHTLTLLVLSTHLLKKAEHKKKLPIIISLTSIESRFKTLHISIRSLLNQNHCSKKIVLWINDNLKDSLPQSLKKLEGELFEIRYSDLNCSHRKLIHSLALYPNDIIVTCDDDLIYRKDWLKNLYAEHLENPGKIIGNQTGYIGFDNQGKLLPYKIWEYDKVQTNDANASFNDNLVFPVGAGGVLYPLEALSKIVLDEELFLKLAPTADDLWFKAMGMLNNTKSMLSTKALRPIPVLGTQFETLKKNNSHGDRNRVQMQNLINYFNLVFCENQNKNTLVK